jgi:MshEN domain
VISRLGSMLVREGLLTPEQHLTAVEDAEDTNRPFVSVVLEQGFVSEDRLVDLMRDRLLVPEADRESLANVDADIIGQVPAKMAEQFLVCPIGAEEPGSLTLLMADASDRHATDEVGYHTGRRVSRQVASESAVRWAIGHYYHVDMHQPQPPWEKKAEESVALLTKIKSVSPAPVSAPTDSDSGEVLLLTPQMRRGVSSSPGALPPLGEQVEGPKPPPMVAPSLAPFPVDLVAVPPLPQSPPAVAPPDSPGKITPPTKDGSDLPEPTSVPQLPDLPMEHTATGRKAGRSETIPYRKERRRRQETIQGLPRMDAPLIRDAGAYVSGGAVDTSSAVPTKLHSPRVDQEISQRPEPAPRSHAGMWSSSGETRAATGTQRSESYSSASLALKRARTRDDVGRILFRYFQEFFLNVAFFVLRKGELAGWDADGMKLSKEKITRILIPTDAQSTFRDVIVGRLPRRGQLDETPVDLKFQSAIGYQPKDVSLVPVMIRDKVIGIIYSDGLFAPIPEDEVSGLLTDAEVAYERLIRQSRDD